MNRQLMKTTLLEYAAPTSRYSNSNQNQVEHSPIAAHADGGSVPPEHKAQVEDAHDEWNALHEFVHGPTMNWMRREMRTKNSLLEHSLIIAAHCAGMRIFQAETDLEEPSEAPADERENFEHFLRLITTCMCIGATMYKDAASGKLVFDGTEEEDNEPGDNDAK